MSAPAKKPGFFRNAFNAFVEARQHQAERFVNGVLLGLDDETLERYGYCRAELSKHGASRSRWL